MFGFNFVIALALEITAFGSNIKGPEIIVNRSDIFSKLERSGGQKFDPKMSKH